MGMRKAPKPPPKIAEKPEPSPAPPSRQYLIGRIEQLTTEIRGADPFASARLAKKLGDVVDRLVRTLTDEERARCTAVAANSWGQDEEGLLRIIERLTGERFLP